ncbi:hypothetical protein PR048_018678 [Dryococelus australis]|uniref:PiggyBac transposable element-derived protein domain-containing protein n=1 Tax=Dryococelus australis TaxID=614101 RepID=A0ABQ9HD75_9NEOP|nr:hypothetical protein PR048_018678 [Dryococelus australis]
MSECRFRFLVNCLLFDDKSTRSKEDDSKTYYMINSIPYIGKEAKRKESVSMKYIRYLSVSIYGTGRNLKMDNWFMSVPLADVMLKDFNLSVVGTFRKNKRGIPPSFLPSLKTHVGSSQFAFESNKMLVSFCPKKEKKDANEGTEKPEVLHFYNETKKRGGGVIPSSSWWIIIPFLGRPKDDHYGSSMEYWTKPG